MRDQEIKADAGKLQMELIPPETLEALASVLTHGCKRYGQDNWKLVDPDRYVGAMLRHFCAYRKEPQGVDSDSGLPHISHVLCNAMFLQYFQEKEKTNALTEKKTTDSTAKHD